MTKNINSINFASNVQNTNGKKATPNQKTPAKLNVSNDNVQLSQTQFVENLDRKWNRTSLFGGYNTYEGYANDKVVDVKLERQKAPLLISKDNITGVLGEKEVNLTLTSHTLVFKPAVFQGKIGDEEINLSITKNFFNNFVIQGKIGDEDIDIQYDSPIQLTKGKNDILTLLLSLKGYSLKIQDGKVKSLSASKQANIDMAQQAMSAAMANNQMMMK